MNPFRRKPVPWWHGLIALVALVTLPFWVVGLIGLIAAAFGGNIFPLLLVMLLALWIIAEL